MNAGMQYENVMTPADTAQPFATTSNGKGYTGRMFNEDLKTPLRGKQLQSRPGHNDGQGRMLKQGHPTNRQMDIYRLGFKSYVKTTRPNKQQSQHPFGTD